MQVDSHRLAIGPRLCMEKQPRFQRNTNHSTDDAQHGRVKSDAKSSEDMLSPGEEGQSSPKLVHKVKNERSILALAVAGTKLFAGTQSGHILVWSLYTFERLICIEAHQRSVLSLFVSQEQDLLFSSAGDAIVNVWCTASHRRLYSIYSTYDVGDVFCVAYSTILQTVYLGSQNTSIQWYDLADRGNRPKPDLSHHPTERNHRFFDSKGPGGAPTPRFSASEPRLHEGEDLEISDQDIKQYAHNGYTYCMLLAGGSGGSVFNDEMLISGGGDGSIKIWALDKANGGAISEYRKLESGDESVLALALDDTFLYSGRLDGAINVWDLETCQLVRRIKSHRADVLTLCVSYGSIYSGSATGNVKQYNSRYECTHEWRAHDDLVLASILAEVDGKQIYVTGGNDDIVAVWDIGETNIEAQKTASDSNDQLHSSLKQLVAFRTVSSNPQYAQDCRRGASWLKNLLKDFGADTDMFSTKDNTNPVVFARFKGKSKGPRQCRTVLFYGHYDVVPAENKQQAWASDPFTMTGVNGYMYGRGVSDNKGPILAAVYAVSELLSAKELTSDVVFLIEGEEECGSRGFQQAIRGNKDIIGNIDWILLANSYWLDDDIPCLTYGLRGVVHATIRVSSERPNLHSGVDGSQKINEAMKDLISILAVLSDSNGMIRIPGFYDPVLRLTPSENRQYAMISKALVSRDPSRGDALQLAEQLKGRWREPSLTIHRINNSGPAGSSVIPHTATATISLRLVPEQTTSAIQDSLQKILRATFADLNTSNDLTVTIDHVAEPWLGDPENKIFQTLKEAIIDVWGPELQHRRGSVSTSKPHMQHLRNGALGTKAAPGTSASLTNGSDHHSQATADSPTSPTEAWSTTKRPAWKPLFIREGGSIPAIKFLEQEFDAPAAHLPCGQASDKAHLDNERLRLSNLYKSKDIFKRVFRDLHLK
ncbi:MAG: hypothetical protein Q9222_006709 [Ikaeria aurantiellina]